MTKEEFASLPEQRVPVALVAVDEIMYEDADRTLLWGYDCDRNSWHVYLKDREIHRVVYTYDGNILASDADWSLPVEDLIPNKRLYPEACDAGFCALLRDKGACLPFTTFDDKRPARQFHGRILVDGALSPREPIQWVA